MALFEGLFGKKKTLEGEDIQTLLTALAGSHEMAIISSQTVRYTADVLDADERLFQIRNTLSRDEVLYNFKGQPLDVQIPFELTLYKGTTYLAGLGMVKSMHTLKLTIPEMLAQEESRASYRVTTFPENAVVTFTNEEFQLVRGSLLDISMTGAGIRPDIRWSQNARLSVGKTIIIDVRIGNEVHLSTTAEVRHFQQNKIGLFFQDLSKEGKNQLFKYIVKFRKLEQQQAVTLERIQQEQASTAPVGVGRAAQDKEDEPKPIANDKPSVLIVGDDEEMVDCLRSVLNRKFHVLMCPFNITELKRNLQLSPSLVLLEISNLEPAHISHVKKVGGLVLTKTPLMYYGKSFNNDFRNRFRGHGSGKDILVNVQPGRKLLAFKQIEYYYKNNKRTA